MIVDLGPHGGGNTRRESMVDTAAYNRFADRSGEHPATWGNHHRSRQAAYDLLG